MKKQRLLIVLLACALLCGVFAGVSAFASGVEEESMTDLTKNIAGAEDVTGRFSLERAGDSLYVDIEIADPDLTDVSSAAVQLLFLIGEAPASGGFTADTVGGIYSFNFYPWLPATGPQPQNIVIPSDDQTVAHAGNPIFSTCIVNAPTVTDGVYRFETVWVLTAEASALLGDSIGFDLRYVNFVGEQKVLGYCSEEENLYDDLGAVGTVFFAGTGQGTLPARDFSADVYSFSAAPVEGGLAEHSFSVPGGVSENSFFQAMWDGDSIYVSLNVADAGASGGGANDWVRLALDLGGVPAQSVSANDRPLAGVYAFNLAPWLPNTGGVPVNYGGVSENGHAILSAIDFSYLYYGGALRLQMRLTLKSEYASALAEGAEIGFTLQYNDGLAAGSDGSAAENFYVWGDDDGAVDNDLSSMGALRLVRNPNGVTESLDELYTMPYFEGNTMLNESVLFIAGEDGTVPDAPLLYTPDTIVSVRSSDLFFTYEEGVDYTLENGKLHRTQNSRIPVVAYEDYYPASENGGFFGGTMRKSGGGYVAFREGYTFHALQVAVTYEHSDTWQGEEIYGKARLLPETMRKLEAGETVRIAFLGDSVTEGANASGVSGAAPYADCWSKMTVSMLKKEYGENSVIAFYDYAKGGMDSVWGIAQSIAVGQLQPDLVVVEFAGNEGTRTPETYAYNMKQIMRGVRRGSPDAEFLFVTNFLPNAEAEMNAGVYENIPLYREELLKLEEEGVAVADIYAAYLCLLQNKRFADMTGNNINHPNDFLGRLYAQIVLRTLSDENPLPEESPEEPGTEDPGTEDPGTEDPGTEDPGTEDPGTEGPGTEPPAEEKGCHSSAATPAGTAAAVLLASAAACLKRRRRA